MRKNKNEKSFRKAERDIENERLIGRKKRERL